MKYLKKICLPTLFTIIVVLSAVFLTKGYLDDLLGLDYMRKDEFIQLLEENIEVFESATSELRVLSENTDENFCASVQRLPMKNILDKGRKKYTYIDNQVIMYQNPYINYSDDIINNIKTHQIKEVLKNLNIERISVYKNYILFVNKTNIKFAVCIAYSKNGNPDGEYLYNIEHITGNWYYCLSK